LRNNQVPFGGALVLLSDDQANASSDTSLTPADELHTCLKYSTFWSTVKKMYITTNIRVQLQNDSTAAIFSRQVQKQEKSPSRLIRKSRKFKRIISKKGIPKHRIKLSKSRMVDQKSHFSG